MANLIGLNVLEVDGPTAPAIRGAATSVGAFNLLTQRGVPNRPARITSYAKFVEQFGGHFSGGLGAYLVRGFFDNGGRTVWVNRVVAADAAPAALTLRDATNDTLRLEAGFRGRLDPGLWGGQLYARVTQSTPAGTRLLETSTATLTGGALAATTDMSTAAPLEVLVDGAATATSVAFTASDFPAGPALATREQIRDAINRHTTDIVASLSAADEIVITSTGAGARIRDTWTRLELATAQAELGFAAGAVAQGQPAALAAVQARVARVDAFDVGDAVSIGDGATTAFAKLVRVDETTGTLEWTPPLANPATFNAADLRVRPREFDLVLSRGGTEQRHVVETWLGLSMESDVANFVERVLNDELRGSKYVVATDEASASGAGQDLPVDLEPTRFTSGGDGTPTAADFIGDPAQRTGFHAFDPIDVQIVVCERSDPALIAAGLAYCAGRGDCMYVGAVPEGYVEAGQAVDFGRAFQGKKVYGALYGPYIKIFDPAGSGGAPVRFVPPQGHVAGVYSRIEVSRGIHKAPAGDEANIVGALDVDYRLTQAELDDLVRNGGINGIRVVPGAGVVVDSSRTLSTDTRWLYVNVRLLFNYVKSSLLQGLSWVRQEPNRDTLWSLVKFNSVTPFLMRLHRQGAFGTGEPDQVFTVVCDETNNPPDEVDQGNFKVEIYLYPSKPAETIAIVVGQQPSGGFASEA